MCEYVCAQTQQLLLSAALPSERAVTSGWRKAAGCGPEVTGSDPKAVGFDKWAVTIFWVTSETEFFFFFLLTGGVYPGKYSQAVCPSMLLENTALSILHLCFMVMCSILQDTLY